MKFDEIVHQLGEFGAYQKRIFFLLCVASMSCGIQIMVSVFTLGVPRHRCAITDLQNETYSAANDAHAYLLNITIPWDEDVGESGGYSRCEMNGVDEFTGEPTTKDCKRWVYDKSLFRTTVVTKFDLVCDQKMARSHARMILMGGLLLGAIGTGVVADIIGRKLALMAMVALHASSAIAVSFTHNFILYIILRFLTGISISGLFLAIFVIGMEFVGPSKRMFVGIVVEVFWALGVMILGGVAYFVRDWDYLQMAVSFPILLLFGYWWLIPESPRWLLAKGRDEEAEDIIRHAAKVNNATLPEKIFDGKTFDEAYTRESMARIFKEPKFLLRLVILCYNWLVCAMVFYGLSLNSGNLAGNIYVNFELMGLVEIIAYIICLAFLNRIGRKMLHISCLIVGGGACLSTIFTVLYADESLSWINTLMALIGKCGAAAAFAIIYIYSAELFPTALRNSLLGVTCLFARMGGMISPYIADLSNIVPGKFGQALPLIVFGATTVAGGLMCLILPETLNRHLPETLEEAVNLGRLTGNGRRRQGSWDTEFIVDPEKKDNEPLKDRANGAAPIVKNTTGDIETVAGNESRPMV